MGFEQWWTRRDLVNLVAHWLVDTGEITSTTGLLSFYEHPERHELDFRAAMTALADGREREPLVRTEDRGMPLQSVPVPERVGVRLPVVSGQCGLFDEVAA